MIIMFQLNIDAIFGQEQQYIFYSFHGQPKSLDQCETFNSQLEEIAQYHKNNNQHLPIFITLNIKKWIIEKYNIDTHAFYNSLEKSILNVFSKNELYLPIDLLNGEQNLFTSIQKNGFPKVSELLGKIQQFTILKEAQQFNLLTRGWNLSDIYLYTVFRKMGLNFVCTDYIFDTEFSNNQKNLNKFACISFNGGLNTPEKQKCRSNQNFIPINPNAINVSAMISCTIKMINSAIENREDILSIDSIPLNFVQIIGRVKKVKHRNQKTMTGDQFYTELTVTDDTAEINVQVFQSEAKEGQEQPITALQACLYSEGLYQNDPVDVLPGWYIKIFAKPKKSETEKKWKFYVSGLQKIIDYNDISRFKLRVIVEHLQRVRGILPINYMEKYLEKQQVDKELQQEKKSVELEKNQQKQQNNYGQMEIEDNINIQSDDQILKVQSQILDKGQGNQLNKKQNQNNQNKLENQKKNDNEFLNNFMQQNDLENQIEEDQKEETKTQNQNQQVSVGEKQIENENIVQQQNIPEFKGQLQQASSLSDQSFLNSVLKDSARQNLQSELNSNTENLNKKPLNDSFEAINLDNIMEGKQQQQIKEKIINDKIKNNQTQQKINLPKVQNQKINQVNIFALKNNNYQQQNKENKEQNLKVIGDNKLKQDKNTNQGNQCIEQENSDDDINLSDFQSEKKN
ncbi:Nucleic acid-binding, OB-fold [Pseudocohnilembus persalinus]|uniref:Nucleic acid-binding, OB-fold n=1 Tax=Pseudocohnilembus persalinus TaxID=266149 RepID=A0A0V0QZI9_PSEPJ|nr:Nucleic acid-binding, OB-fold [Pseudocohnilembus persalinus]|eukprot:KRX07686.1 Nucleic acid-binding, OB-fold [Pseudocohnilembus persalinus]